MMSPFRLNVQSELSTGSSNPKKRRKNNAQTAMPPQPPPIVQDLLPPPLTGYGDTIVASNPFDDCPITVNSMSMVRNQGPPPQPPMNMVPPPPMGPVNNMNMCSRPMGPNMGMGSQMMHSPNSHPMMMMNGPQSAPPSLPQSRMNGPTSMGGGPPPSPHMSVPPHMMNAHPNGHPSMHNSMHSPHGSLPSPMCGGGPMGGVGPPQPPPPQPNVAQMNANHNTMGGGTPIGGSGGGGVPPMNGMNGPMGAPTMHMNTVNGQIGPPHNNNNNNFMNMPPMANMYSKPLPVSAGKVYPADQPMVFNSQNPNAPPIYPCGICHKEVHDNDQAILCESGCNFWFHRGCTGLTEAAFQLLTAEVYAEWVCDKCLTTKNIPLVKFKP